MHFDIFRWDYRKTRAADIFVLPNIDRTQAAEITPGSNATLPSVADARCLQQAYTIRMLPGVTVALSAFLSLVTLTFDLWPWHLNSLERGTKHVFCVNLVQICWAVPEIFYSQTNKTSHTVLTSSSAIAEGPRDALSQLKSCQLLHKCMKNHIWLQGLSFHAV